MSSIDMVISAVIMLGVISFAIFFVNDNLQRSLNDIKGMETKAMLSAFSKELFTAGSPLNIMTSSSDAEIVFRENGNYSHTELVQILITPAIANPKLYDYSFAEIPTTVEQSSGQTKLKVSSTYSSGERKYFKLFYDGSISAMSFTATNISATGVAGKSVPLASIDACSSLNYNNSLSISRHSFRLELDSCIVGSQPPNANVYINQISLLSKSGTTIKPVTGRLMMW